MARPASSGGRPEPAAQPHAACYVFGPILTGFTNRDPVVIGSVVLPAMTLYSSISMAAEHAIMVMPFVLGAAMLGTERDHGAFLRLTTLAGLAYSLPTLVEVVKGPIFGALVYGLNPGVFYAQQMRDGGFRAMVFLGHGLLVSAFLGMAILAAVGMWRSKYRVMGFAALPCAGYLFIVLVLNKSTGALLLTLLLAPLLALLPTRRFLRVALIVALMIVTYPILRANGLIPVDKIESMFAGYSEERAGSLDFRLRNEDILLNRWHERPFFGWGSDGRNRVFVVTDWGTTQDVTITDGTWIIELGTDGWLGYLSLFGLLCYPFLHLARARRQVIAPATAAAAAMLLFNLLDLIPNSSLRPLTFLLAGALSGLVRVRRSARSSSSGTDGAGSPRSKVLTHA